MSVRESNKVRKPDPTVVTGVKGASPETSASTQKKSKALPKKKPVKKTKWDPLSIGGGPNPDESRASKAGFSVHRTTDTRGKNAHEPAADARAMRRVKALDSALKFARARGNTYLVIAWPSPYEVSLAGKIDIIRLYRAHQRGFDLVKDLKLHDPDIPKGANVVVVINDCPMAAPEELYNRFIRNHGGKLWIFTSGLSLAGAVGVDYLGKTPTAVWQKIDGVVHTLALGCISQYRDVVSGNWLDYTTGQLTPTLKFYHKLDGLVGTTGYYGRLLVTPGQGTEFVKMHYPLSKRGVLVDDDGFMPVLRDQKWARDFGATAGASRAMLKEAEKQLKLNFGNLYFLDQTHHTKLRDIVQRAMVKTINSCVLEGAETLVVPAISMANEAALEAARRKYSDLPGGDLVAVIGHKQSAADTLAGVFRALKKIVFQIYNYLRTWYNEHIATRDPLVDEEEQLAGITSCNVIFSLSRMLKRCGKKLGAYQGSAAKGFGQGLRRAAKVLRAPFPSKEDPEEDLLVIVLKLIATMGTVLLERALASMFGPISALVVALVEIFALLMTEESAGGRIFSTVVTALGHLILAILPFWISIPLHLLADTVILGNINQMFRVIRFHGVKGMFRELATQITATLDGIFRFTRSVAKNGEFFDEQLFEHPEDEMALGSASWTLVEAPEFTCFTMNGEKFDKNALVELETIETKSKRANFLVDLDCLEQVALTPSNYRTFVSAVTSRYQNIVPAPKHVKARSARMAISLVILLDPHKDGYAPATLEEFRSHMVTASWSASKVKEYEKCILLHEKGKLVQGLTAPVIGKGRELLKSKNGVVRTRIVHTFPPSTHYPHILEAMGLKKALAEAVADLKMERCGWTIGFFRPVTGTSTEMTEAFSAVGERELLIAYSGDDSKILIGTKEELLEMSADLKSCDTTLQEDLLGSIYYVLRELGASDQLIENNFELNRMEKQYTTYTDDGRKHVMSLALPFPINSSGTCLTTLITDVACLLLWTGTIKRWNGDLGHLISSLRTTADDLGLILDIEKHPDTRPDGLTEAGLCTFLSYCFVYDEGVGKSFVVSHTKSLVAKGANQSDRGKSIDFAVASRASNASLGSTPYGKAIRGALRRHIFNNPTSVGSEANHGFTPYQTVHDSKSCLTEHAEYRYLQRIMPTLSPLDYHQELETWNEIDSFPAEVAPGAMPIFTALAYHHYGYETVDDFLKRETDG